MRKETTVVDVNFKEISMAKGRHRETPFTIDGVNGVIVHNMLVADGPIDPVTRKPLINPKTGKAYPGKNDDIARLLPEFIRKLRGERDVDGVSVARFGIFTNTAHLTSIFLYDHPKLKEICDTAFTDGTSVFLDADFFRKAVEEENKYREGRGKFGIIPILIHELYHKIKKHNVRMKNIPHGIANAAQDRNINANYKMAFGKEVPLIPMLTVMLESGTDASAIKYHDMSEELIGRQMLQEYEARHKEIMDESKKKKKKGNSPGGSGMSGGSQGPGGDSDEFNPDSEDSQPGSGNSGELDEETKKKLQELEDEYNGDTHHVTIEDMIKILDEEGLENVAKALDYPKPGDEEGLEKLAEKTERSIDTAVQKTLGEMNSLPDKSGYPGAHIASEVASMIRHMRKKKLQWKMDILNTIVGDSPKEKQSDDFTTDVYYLDMGDGLSEIYDPAMTQQKSNDVVVVIFDSSGSTRQGQLRENLASEVLGLAEASSFHEHAKEVILFFGDSVVRGEPLVIDRSNIEILRQEGIPVFGDGGTNLSLCLKTIVDHPTMAEKNVKHVIYATDCEDSIPDASLFDEFFEKPGRTITFLTQRSAYSENWDKELTYGKVVFVDDDEGQVVSLDAKDRQVKMSLKK